MSARARTTVLTKALTTSALALVLATTTSCSLVGGEDEQGSAASDTVVLVTHDSFSLPDEVVAAFEEESGYELELRPSGDAGLLTNELVASKGSPPGDAVFGIDNTFASRALAEGVLAPYDGEWPAGVDDYALPGDDERALTPVDNGNVCVNVDTAWFAANDLEPPSTLDDLVDPAYRDLLVTPGATTSSPGLAFLLTTVDEYGDAWPDYWADLLANGAKVVSGWEDAYNGDFTQGGGSGERPIVVSYDSSPAFTVADGETSTRALLDTCFLQVEYAGILEGADNPAGAEELIDFLVGPTVQEALPESMYVFPVADGTALPAAWAEFAPRPSLEQTHAVDPADVDASRDEWLREWSDVVSR